MMSKSEYMQQSDLAELGLSPPQYSEYNDSNDNNRNIYTHENSTFIITPPPSLQRPIVIPQMVNGVGLPFSRAYSPVLQAHGISADEFIGFVDNLNKIYTSKSSVQALGIASTAVDYLPIGPLRLLGGAFSMVARGVANSGQLNEFLNSANQEIFIPKNLKVMICNTQDLGYILNLSPSEVMTLSSMVEYSLHKRMSSLNDYIAPLNFDIPSSNSQLSTLPKVCQTQIRIKRRENERNLTQGGWIQPGWSRQSREVRRLERDMERFERRSDRRLFDFGYGNSYLDTFDAVERERDMRTLQDDMIRLEMESIAGSRQRARRMQDRRIRARDELQWLLVVNL